MNHCFPYVLWWLDIKIFIGVPNTNIFGCLSNNLSIPINNCSSNTFSSNINANITSCHRFSRDDLAVIRNTSVSPLFSLWIIVVWIHCKFNKLTSFVNESRNVYILLFKFIKLLKTNWLMTTKIHHFPELNHRLSRKVYVTIFYP